MDINDVDFGRDGKAEVVVHVPSRAPSHDGYWAIGRYFPQGKTGVSVTKEELERLLRQPVITVTTKAETLEAEKDTKPSGEEAEYLRQLREAQLLGRQPAFLNPEEQEMLTQMRSISAPAAEGGEDASALPGASQREAEHHGKRRGR